jgi:superfamily II DNA or RNA helicase
VIENVKTVDEYLAAYAGQLGSAVVARSRPLFDPLRDSWSPRMQTLLRKPFRAQGDVIMGAATALRRRADVQIIGETGVGKTLMGAAICHAHFERAYRVLVMCPPHLVRKWAREVTMTIPKARAYILHELKDVVRLRHVDPPEAPEFYVVSRERAKLGYFWKPAFVPRLAWERQEDAGGSGRRKRRLVTSRVPACPRCGGVVRDADGNLADETYLAKQKRWCLNAVGKAGRACREALWTADPARIHRYPIAEYIHRFLGRGVFDAAIADEIHELKGGETAQGHALASIFGAARKQIGMTGTLMGGYADDLFHLLYRSSASAMVREGLKHGDSTKWMERYGVLEWVTKERVEQDHACSQGRRVSKSVKRKPGVSPVLFGRHLLSSALFLQLDDLAAGLPSFTEDVVAVRMNDEQKQSYDELEKTLGDAMRDALRQGSKRLLGTFLMGLLAYPDRPFDNEPIVDAESSGGRKDQLIVIPQELSKKTLYPKEKALLETVEAELAQGRRVWVYCTFTQKKDVTERLAQLLKQRGIRTAVMRSSVPSETREEWVEQQMADGVRVVISNPKLVETGLDLLGFPTLLFYQTGYSVFTLRQSSRRSWRIGQTEPVRVKYFYYDGTLQEKALRLMGAKVRASLSVEGKFSSEGLVALCQGEDMMTAMAKAVADQMGDGVESAESYWRRREGGEEARTREAAVGLVASAGAQTALFEMAVG